MSVKLLDNDAFYGYRVRRTVNSKLFQEYFSLKQSGKRINGAVKKKIEKKAFNRDSELASSQSKAKQANKAERCFNANGSVRGISYLVKTEKSGTKTPIFQLGIASELDGKIICTSYSINAHGKDHAWALAVTTFAKHKGVSKGSKLYKQLIAAMPKQAANAKVKKSAAKTSKKSPTKKAVKKVVASKSSTKLAAKSSATKKKLGKASAKKSPMKNKATKR